MEDLKIGELVVLRNPYHFKKWNGALAVVEGLRCRRIAFDPGTGERQPVDGYSVRVLDRDGIAVICERRQIYKLPGLGSEESELEESCSTTPTPEIIE